MLNYSWEYPINSGELVRINSRVEQRSEFYGDEARKRIVFWLVEKNNNVECDGKAAWGGENLGHPWIMCFWYWTQKDSSEDQFLEDIAKVNLLDEYCKMVVDNDKGRGWEDYYRAYTRDTEGRVREIC